MPEDLKGEIRFCPIIEYDADKVRAFSCENSSIDRYLISEAHHDHLKREASTTLVFHEQELIGYFTLLHRPIEIEEEDEDGNPYIAKPVALDIYRLAIAQDKQNKGFGSLILNFIEEIAIISNEQYITLDALFGKRYWYRERGFEPAVLAEFNIEGSSSEVFMYKRISYKDLLDQLFYEP